MKIYLTVNEEDNKPGYYWCSPKNPHFKNPEGFYNCWDICMEAQCTEFYAPSILDVFSISEIEQLLPKYAKLIAKGGKITLGGTDIYLLSKETINRSKDLGTINQILFEKGFNIRSITSVESTRKFLETLKFSINKIDLDYNSFSYTVEAIKNA